jgi:hypothetical protein
MLKKMSAIVIAGLLALTISACSKQEQAKQGQAPAPAPNKLILPQKGQQATVTIPAEVKGKWKAVKLTVLDKNKKTSKDFEAKIGEDTPIPGTKLSIKAEDFVPAFVMQGMNVTSASNEPTNPAAKVIITENGKEIFKGWLFQRFPSTHAFNHPEFAITLTGGVRS